MAEICEICGTPDTETELESRGHGEGWLMCVGKCKPRHTVFRRVYSEVTAGVLDQLENEADLAQMDFQPVEIPPQILHTLIRIARSTV